MVPKPENKKVPVVVDYLRNLAEKRSKKNDKPGYLKKSRIIKNHIKHPSDMSPKDQYDEVKEFSRLLNEKAAMKAMEQKTQGNSKNINLPLESSQVTNEVNDLIVESINNKLMYLQKF